MSSHVPVRLLVLAALIAGCSSSNDFGIGPTPTGTVKGTVSSSLGGGLSGVSVVVTPSSGQAMAAVTTDSTGAFRVPSVPILNGGQGSIAISALPTNCTAPTTATAFSSLNPNDSVSVPVTATCTQTTGSLLITVSAPAGVSGSMTVTGPNSYSKTVSGTDTIKNLAPGSYTVAAATVNVSGAVALSSDTATVGGSPATVAVGTTAAVTVTYTAIPTFGLWVASNTGTNAYEAFINAQLTATGAPTPSAKLNISAPAAPIAIAFDHSGNMWSVDGATNLVSKFTAATLGTPSGTAAATITDASLSDVTAMAFDANGNLWLADYYPCSIVEYTAAQLSAASGAASVAPALTLNGCGFDASLSGPAALAFDANGNLWVADIDNDAVYQYTASSLTGSGAITAEPAVRLTTTDMMQPQYLSIDATGNLWVSNNAGRIVKFSTTQMAASGSLTPAKTITVAGAAFEGLAFDVSGNLWVADNATGSVDAFTTAQLGTGGTIVPATAINATNGGAANMSWSVAFNPHTTTVPLYNRVAGKPPISKRFVSKR